MDDLFRQLSEDPGMIEKVLNPGDQLYDIDVNDLQIHTLDSGFPSLDDPYMVLKDKEGELVIIAARPSQGKSALCFQIALHVALKKHVHVFSLEMSHESIVRRLLSSIIDRPVSAIQMGLVDSKILGAAKEKLKKYNYTIDDRGGLTADDICDAAVARSKKSGTGLVVIDHLQIVKRLSGHSVHEEIGLISSKFKNLAKQLNCPVIVACQLNRQCEMRENKRPILSDLKESGSIEENADVVLGIYREERYTNLRVGEADLLILKNRNGQVGEVVVNFYAAQTRFHDDGRGSNI